VDELMGKYLNTTVPITSLDSRAEAKELVEANEVACADALTEMVIKASSPHEINQMKKVVMAW